MRWWGASIELLVYRNMYTLTLIHTTHPSQHSHNVVVFPLDYKPIAPPKIGTAWVIVIAVALGYELDGGMVGLILSYSAVMTGLLNWGVRRSVYLLRLYIYT